MPPTDGASFPSVSGSVAALFGDETDSQPLWFRKDAFSEPNFDSEAYIADLRRFVPLETLRGELKSHLASLKNELVELINRDYTDFVNLSTKLVDVDGAVLRMRMPLNDLRGKLVAVRSSVASSLTALEDGLQRRADVLNARQTLELLLDTSHVLSKVEKLLEELTEEPGHEAEGGPRRAEVADLGSPKESGTKTVEDANPDRVSGRVHARLLERIASEINRLNFYVARGQDLPFVCGMAKRIAAAEEVLTQRLRRCIETGLATRDEPAILYCLRGYAAIDDTAGAEDAFRAVVVAPFVAQLLPSQGGRGGGPPTQGGGGPSGENLAEVFEGVLQHVRTDCKFLLDLASKPNSGLHAFDFLSNSILKEVFSAISSGRPGAFAPGKPAEFLTNYKASLKFLAEMEQFCSSQAAVVAFRAQPAYNEFLRPGSLGVYFTLRFQEIASGLDALLVGSVAQPVLGGPTRLPGGGLALALQTSAALWESLLRCWHPDVYVSTIADRFLRLTFQLLSRYMTWLSVGLNARRNSLQAQQKDSSATAQQQAGGAAGAPEADRGGEWAITAAPDDFFLVLHDVKLLSELVKTTLLHDHIAPLLSSTPPDVAQAVQASVTAAGERLLEHVGPVTEVLTEAIAEKCFEGVKQLKGIVATFRMTNKPLPTTHSLYVGRVLQPLKACFDGERATYVPEDVRRELARAIVEKVTVKFDEDARGIVENLRKTEASLIRIGRRRPGGNVGPGGSNITDHDKICQQLFLDVKEYGRQMKNIGLPAETIPSYISLWQGVAPADKQNVEL